MTSEECAAGAEGGERFNKGALKPNADLESALGPLRAFERLLRRCAAR